MVCQLGGVVGQLVLLRGRALCNGLPGVCSCPVTHNVVLPFLVGIKLSLGNVVTQSGFIGLVGFQMGDGIGIARDSRILRGVLGFDIRDFLLVGGVVTLKRGNTLLMVCQLGGVVGQLCGVLGNELTVRQLCGLCAVYLGGQRGIGVVGLGVQLGKVGLGLFATLFQFVQSAVLLNVLLLNVGDCIPVGLNLCLVLGKVSPEPVRHAGKTLNGLMVCRDFLMLGGKTALMVCQLCGMVGQLVSVLGNVRGIVLNVLGILGNVGGVLGNACVVALELGIDAG